MSNLLHVCIYNTEPESSKPLQAQVTALNFVRLVAEVGSAEALAKTLHQATVNLIFFHLDPNAPAVVEVIDHVSTKYPELALIAVSHQTNPEAILAPMRAGCDQFVCEPIDHNDLANAVARVASRRLLSNAKSRCICVVGSSGGAGTTSIACNLALEIGNLADRDCALVDLDLQFGDVALNFDCEPRYTIHDLAESGNELDRSILATTVTTLPCKVALLSRPETIEQHEAITPEVIHRVIELMALVYENVVIDVPGRFDIQTIAAMGQADLILIICQLQVPSLRNAKRFFETLTRMGVPEERIEVVINRSDGKSGRLTERDVEETLKKPVFAIIPNDYQFVARSIDFGRPIAALDRNSPVRAAIRKMARKIVAGPAVKPPEKEARKGLFSRLLSK
jgi:pilus assembly protein CpaE